MQFSNQGLLPYQQLIMWADPSTSWERFWGLKAISPIFPKTCLLLSMAWPSAKRICFIGKQRKSPASNKLTAKKEFPVLGTEGKCFLLPLTKAEFFMSQCRDSLQYIETPAIHASHCTVPRPWMHKKRQSLLHGSLRENIQENKLLQKIKQLLKVTQWELGTETPFLILKPPP